VGLAFIFIFGSRAARDHFYEWWLKEHFPTAELDPHHFVSYKRLVALRAAQ
jgi:hypothetical protein